MNIFGFSQPGSEKLFTSLPCQESQAPVFPGGTTLCVQNANFNPDYTISNGTLASNLNLTLWPSNLSAFTNKKILIQGIFYLNIPVAFNNCVVKLAPGAQIIVGTPSLGTPTLTEILSLRTKYFSCETMWKGIVIKAGNRARFYWSTIEDAQYAITVGNHVSIAMYGNTFNRNFVSITNDASTTTLPVLLFKKNTFNCTSALHELFDLDFPNFGDIDPVSFAGILLQNCVLNLGYYNTDNKFKYLTYGVAAKNSTVNIKGCEFSDAQVGIVIPDLLEELPAASCGIRTVAGELFVEGNEEQKSSYFYRGAGIHTSGSDCFVSFAGFEDASLTCDENFAGQTIFIDHNLFFAEAGTSVINVERSMASGSEIHTTIVSNALSHESPQIPGRLIFVNGVNNATDYADIVSNNLYFENEDMNGISISLFQSDNFYIAENNVLFSGEDYSAGINIWLGTTEGTDVFGNVIEGTFFETFTPTTGIKGFVARGPTYCANTSRSLGYGLGFYGNCDNSHITQNFLGIEDGGILGIGLYVVNAGTNGVIGKQLGTRNYFMDPGSEYEQDLAALYESNADPVMSQYIITESDASNPIYYPEGYINPSSGWFEVFGDGNVLCGGGTLNYLTKHDSLAIESDPNFEQLPAPIKFYTEKSMLALIMSDDDLMDEYNAYLSTKVGTPEYIIANTEVALKEAYQMNTLVQEGLDSLLEVQRNEIGRFEMYDDYNYSNIDTITFGPGSGQDSIIAILERIRNIAESKQDIRENRINNLTIALTEIRDSLDTFSPVSLYEDYYKSIYLLRIKRIIEGELDSIDSALLYDIAHDVTDSSYANVTAFGMFDLCGDCLVPDYILSGEKIRNVEFGPTMDGRIEELSLLKIEDFPMSHESSILMSYILDLTGRVVAISRFDNLFSPENQLNSLPSGLYYHVIFDYTGKVVSSNVLTNIQR